MLTIATSDVETEREFLAYFGPLHDGGYGIARLLGGCLVIGKNNEDLTAVMRDCTEKSAFYIAATGLSTRKIANRENSVPDNAVLKHVTCKDS